MKKMKKWNKLCAAVTASVLCLMAAPSVFPHTYTVRAATSAAASVNATANNYTVYADLVNSYLVENKDGSYSRIESTNGKNVVVESYAVRSSVGKPNEISLGSKTITGELPYFGGFYEGEDFYFLVFGQDNEDEDDETEVLRVVKYSKSWERLESCSIYGANTYDIFNAGSLRMTETDGSLFIHTCHSMYASSDSLHHQANMTFRIDEETMTEMDSFYGIRNISVGYCSHSFNQYIETDGAYVYRVDHGDAYPRSVVITRFNVGSSITDTDFIQVLPICGETGTNATGVSVGGFALSTENCLVVGNSVEQIDSVSFDTSGQRNIFLTVTNQELTKTDTIWLTDYTQDDGITPYTPQLVKVSDDQFLVQWEEYNSETGLVTTKMMTVDGSGNRTSDVVSTLYRLSDCQPIVASDGLVKWYVTQHSGNSTATTFYAIDPNDLEAQEVLMTSDLDNDGKVTIQDAYNTLLAYAKISVGLDSGLLDVQIAAADVDGDGTITITDAYRILLYYATESAGGDPSWT
ncbi:MAG: hypothetical protein LUC50_04195 [Ruminococcus sp.]|nr:hypothetical protein [Ruminococcus sp.]